MGPSTAERSKKHKPKGAAVIGGNWAAVQAALALARIGVEVKLIAGSAALCGNKAVRSQSPGSSPDRRYLWPLLLQAASHPLITLYSNADVDEIKGGQGDFKLRVSQHPRYINGELCTACGRCEAECSVKLTSFSGDRKLAHGAIHAPIIDDKSVPSAYLIDKKNGVAPCLACPLGINVQGFVSLLSKGKTDKALALINEAAPLAGILGRVCTHPCENNCNRAQVDSPVAIRALHRYAADNAPSGIRYRLASPASPRQGKIAIIGSGPAGLTAAWALKRLGYSLTVFESHGVVGGMLATGIPRFRLPKEVREREIEAIRKMGVDIRTGITFGRDINFAYLKERGYQAVFLAIGTQHNNSLDIPGEEIDDVVDCLSLLLALNLKLDTFVGSKVAVIGGGNAAIDAARSALRSGAKTITIFYRRTKAEMTANAEEVEEAIREGVKIEYNAAPVKILGEKGKVTAILFQRTQTVEEANAGKRGRVEMIPGTDFRVDADHVVVAIGQSPDASQLNMKGLAINETTGSIQVNPLTLQTSLPGIFAGGDCITGPNNVVQAMADGLRAAESIDRLLQGHDLEAERTLEPPPVAEIDLDNAEISPDPRVEIPYIQSQDRIMTYEETTLGIAAEAAQKETRRCLNCALCSRCLECTTSCELGAVLPDDTEKYLEIEVDAILRFPSNGSEKGAMPGIPGAAGDSAGGFNAALAKAAALALETAIELKQGAVPSLRTRDDLEPEGNLAQPPQTRVEPGTARLGVFLCSCGKSISSVVDFESVSRKLAALAEVAFVHEIPQACTEAGARQIAELAAGQQLDRMVLAACRCCNLEQVCYGCTDRRQMCQQHLNRHLVMPRGMMVEFCNIREQCAWIHRDDPQGATLKALQIILAGITSARTASPVAAEKEPILPSIFILGGGLPNAVAARALASRGYKVEMTGPQGEPPELQTVVPPVLKKFQKNNLVIRPWPDSFELHGPPGNYEVRLKYSSQPENIRAGAILVNTEELFKEPDRRDTSNGDSRLQRILTRQKEAALSSGISQGLLHEVTIGATSGIFALSPARAASSDDLTCLGLATAARITAYLEQKKVAPRANAVSINRRRCRGCGDCADICSYIEMHQSQDGISFAGIDKAFCLGCGACITVCPSGAITQPLQGDRQIIAAIASVLTKSHADSED